MSLIINGKNIDEDVVYAEFSSVKAYFESLGNVSCCERDDEFRGYAKQNIIARFLMAEEAERRMPAPAEEAIDAALDAIRKDQGEFQFAATVATHPDQMDGLRREMSTNPRVQALLEQVFKEVPEPTDAEVREFYEKNIAAFMTPEEVRASHISKNPGRGENRGEIYQKLCEVRRRIRAGADFDELAREHSDKGKEQIDLGFFKRGEYPEEFEIVAFSMDVGELSPVFSSTYGYHIAKVTDRKASEPRPFDEVREDARQALINERRKAKTQALVEDLKKTATIVDCEPEGESVPAHVHQA